MYSVNLNNVTKKWGDVTAVDQVNLHINEGEFVVLLGPSGCGKTTTMRLVAGLEDITDGEIKIGDEIVNDVDPRKRDVSMVFQNYSLFPHMTVRNNIAYPLKMKKIPTVEHDKLINDVSTLVELQDLLHRKPAELSGGQRQRVALARAIVRQPRVFLMDEPLSNLDAILRVTTRAELKNLHHRLGVTTIYVTHDQVEAMTLANRIAVMNHGKLLQFDEPQVIFDDPSSKFVAGFIGSPAMNMMEGKISGISDKSLEIELEGQHKVKVLCNPNENVRTGAPVHFGVRPEHLDPEGNGDAKIPAKVFAVERLGGETYLYVNTREGREFTVHAPGDKVVYEGEEISVGVSSESCHVFNQQGTAFERLAA